MLSLTELAKLTNAMRAAQVRYFRERTPVALEESKRLEREVDRAVADILSPNWTPVMFGD